jgi:hypothetical protein
MRRQEVEFFKIQIALLHTLKRKAQNDKTKAYGGDYWHPIGSTEECIEKAGYQYDFITRYLRANVPKQIK